MSSEKTATIARAIADDLARICSELDTLATDASDARLHRCVLRLSRVHEILKTTAHGLRIQASKLAPKSTP